MTRQSLEQIKDDILQKFNTKYNSTEIIKVMTREEFINTDNTNAPYKYYRMQISKGCWALNFLNGESIIFIPEKSDYNIEDLLQFTSSCFHELRHTYQQKQISSDNFYNFMMQIEYTMQLYNQQDYINDHDSFYSEIDAINYGFSQSHNYLIQNYPLEYEKYMNASGTPQYHITYSHIKEITDKYEPHNTVDKIVYAIQKKVIKTKTGVPPVLYNFINEDGTYKPFTEIINNKNLRTIDERIILSVLSSRTFMSSINIYSLSPKERVYLKEALKQTEKQINLGIKTSNISKQIQKYYNERLRVIGYRRATSDIVKMLQKKIIIKINSMTNSLRQERQRDKHKKQIPIYIKKLTRV